LAVGAGHPTLTRLRPGPSLAVVGAAAVLLLATLRPPAPPSASYADGLRAAASPDATARRLRMVRAEEGARAQLARRPADPASWLLLAWLRRDPVYRFVLEHVGPDLGAQYLEHALRQTPELGARFDRFRTSDLHGGPVTHPFPPYGDLSPTTLRYVKVLSDLVQLFGPL